MGYVGFGTGQFWYIHFRYMFFRYSQFRYTECQYRYSHFRYIQNIGIVNFGTCQFQCKRLRYKSSNEPISGDGALWLLNNAFRGWFRSSSRSSNIHNMHCNGAGTRHPFKRPQLRKPGRRRWRVCWRWFALWPAGSDQCLMSWTRTFNLYIYI